jgi:ribonuclease BN (tRNA processing enzyme)
MTVLGACGTYPAPGRACSGYLLESSVPGNGIGGDGRPGARVWVDAGAGTFSNLLLRTPLTGLDAVYISHLHADHLSDLALCGHALAFGHEPIDAPMPLFGPKGLTEHLRLAMPAEVPGALDKAFEIHELNDGERIDVNGMRLDAVATHHSIPTYGLRASVSSGGPVIAYSADSGPCDALGKLAEDADVFVCEASWMDPPDGVPPIHLTPEQAGHYANKGGARRLVLTHLRADMPGPPAIEQARQAYQGEVEVALEGGILDTVPVLPDSVARG